MIFLEYILENEMLSLRFSTLGAELLSARRGDFEYIWQGAPGLWREHAPLLFPICSHLTGDIYTYRGKTYAMGAHGFARKKEFTLADRGAHYLSFLLRDDETTRAVYPFPFCLRVTYTLTGDCLTERAVIENPGTEFLPAAFGGHPGFSLPFPGNRFEDCYLDFGEGAAPREVVLSVPDCFDTGKREPYPLREGRYLPLARDLFAVDGHFLADTTGSVTLRARHGKHFVRMDYADFPYLGFWQNAKGEPGFLCLEPWYGLPTRVGVTDDLALKNDLLRIRPGDSAALSFSVVFGEKNEI